MRRAIFPRRSKYGTAEPYRREEKCAAAASIPVPYPIIWTA